MDPGSILWRALFFSFFFSLSLSARWFNTYQIPILFLSSFSFFPSLALFFSLFCPPLTFPLPSFFFSFSYSFPILFLLLVSFFLPLSAAFLSLFPPFLHFSHRLALMPTPPPATPSKNPGENTVTAPTLANFWTGSCFKNACSSKGFERWRDNR